MNIILRPDLEIQMYSVLHQTWQSMLCFVYKIYKIRPSEAVWYGRPWTGPHVYPQREVFMMGPDTCATRVPLQGYIGITVYNFV